MCEIFLNFLEVKTKIVFNLQHPLNPKFLSDFFQIPNLFPNPFLPYEHRGRPRQIVTDFTRPLLTLVVVLGRNGEHGVLYVLVLVHFGLVQCFVEVRRVIVLVRDADPYEFRY